MTTAALVPEGTLGAESVDSAPGHGHEFGGSNSIDYINGQPLEMYIHYARLEREREANDTRAIPDAPWIKLFKRITKKNNATDTASFAGNPAVGDSDNIDEKSKDGLDSEKHDHPTATTGPVYTEEESDRAYLALRTASWQGVFFLITTDILGFSSAPYAFLQTGYIAGTLVFLFFYILAFLGGQILWRMYMDMDSSRFPVKCYADLGERTYGRYVRHIFNVLQSLQLILNVGIIVLGNATTLASVIEYKFCFSIINFLFMLTGICGGQIRSLKNFAWFANINVWLNVVIMILTMVGVAVYDPVPSLNAELNGYDDIRPIVHHTWVPPGENWFTQIEGIQLIVFAYGGAMIFTEFMAEMRRPRDFWRSAFLAQTFIFLIYMFFGLFVYAYQGQYTYLIPSLGFANRALSLVTNIMGLVTGTVAAVLYGNIGTKIFYYNVLQPYLHAPPISTTKGRWWWSITTFIYWSLAFVLASAIPSLSSMLTLVGAACILQGYFTVYLYLPPILLCGFMVQKDAIEGDRPWQPGMAPWSNRIDTWRQMSRWKRGFAKYWYFKCFLILIFLGALALCGLGIYSGVEQLIPLYKGHVSVSFSCRAPGQPADTPTPP